MYRREVSTKPSGRQDSLCRLLISWQTSEHGYNRVMNTPLPIRFASFLAPNMWPVYEYVVAEIGRWLNHPTELVVGSSFAQFAAGEVDAGFL